MLQITVSDEGFNDETQEFVIVDQVTIELEHSLVSLSKWESKYQKPFLGAEEKTAEETLDYLKMMILTENVSDDVFKLFDDSVIKQIKEYIESPQSATTFNEPVKSRGRPSEVITSELIYYWMTAFQIDWQSQYWHLNRLLNVIRIASIKNGKQNKIPKSQLRQTYRDLNEQRKAKYGTSG